MTPEGISQSSLRSLLQGAGLLLQGLLLCLFFRGDEEAANRGFVKSPIWENEVYLYLYYILTRVENISTKNDSATRKAMQILKLPTIFWAINKD